MGITQIGYKGATQLQPNIDVSQNSGQQYITRFLEAQPITLLAGQTYLLPGAQWQITTGRYTQLQWYDTGAARWRNMATQPGQTTVVSSDGTNVRLLNSTGTPIGALPTNIGAGNATNGYNTVGVTVSGGASTWGTLVGGTVNTTVTLGTSTGANGNYALAPHIVWTPAANQTLPFVSPRFTSAVAANGNITSITVASAGAGLTAPGTLQAVQQPSDTNPGNANLTGVLAANLTNSGNLTAMWPLTPGTGLTSVPTFTFNVGGGMAATAIMNFTVTGITVANVGANLGVSGPAAIISANGIVAGTLNANITGTADFGVGIAMPRMAWLSTKSEANGNFSNNGNVVVVDGGINIQAIPSLAYIPANMNGISTNALPVLTAEVGGVTDVSFIQAL